MNKTKQNNCLLQRYRCSFDVDYWIGGHVRDDQKHYLASEFLFINRGDPVKPGSIHPLMQGLKMAEELGLCFNPMV